MLLLQLLLQDDTAYTDDTYTDDTYTDDTYINPTNESKERRNNNDASIQTRPSKGTSNTETQKNTDSSKTKFVAGF
jgi:hypothetical protein